jgi:hypothetical protein
VTPDYVPMTAVSCSQCGIYFERNGTAQKMCSDECRADRRRRARAIPVAIRQVIPRMTPAAEEAS